MIAAPAKSVLQSPWYWAYAFCAAGLISLVLLGGKFAQRQSQIERQHQGRQRAHARLAAADKSTDGMAPPAADDSFASLSTPDTTIIGLEPLFVVLAAAGVASWSILWWTHFRRRTVASTPSARHTP